MRTLLALLLLCASELGHSHFAQNEKFSDCLFAIRTRDLSRPATPIVAKVFSYNNNTYQIPTKFRGFAEQIAGANIREDVKESYLLALQDINGPKNPLHSVVSEGWQNEFNRRLIAAQNEIKTSDVVIVVHQKEDWQDATAEFLAGDEKLKDVPVISLNSPTFPMKSDKLLNRADQVRLSELGEINNLPESASRFHLMGGWCNKCVSKAVQDIVKSKVAANQKTPVDIFIYSSLSYTMAALDQPSLASQVHGKSTLSLMDAADFYNIERSFPGGAITSIPEYVETEHGPAYRMTVTGREYDMPLNVYVLAK